MVIKTPAKTQEERTQEAKEKIYKSSLELFALNGYFETTLAQISQRAGYSRALAQYHYENKTALALELLEIRMKRDLNINILSCPSDISAEEAWKLLQKHLDFSSKNYGNLHGNGNKNIQIRGEIALQSAAVLSSDLRLRNFVNEYTSLLISKVSRILEICRKSNFIDENTDIQSAAIFYVHSIWGLASALYANPNGQRQIENSFKFLATILDKLRTK